MKLAYLILLMFLKSSVLCGQSAGTLDITFDSDGLLFSNPGTVENRGVDVYGKLAKIFYTSYNNIYQKSVSVHIGDLPSGIYYIKLNKQQGLGTKFVKIDQ